MAIQQHPIPQNVTSYQFRLIGDMTLKQFLQLAAGIVVGLIIYASPLPGFIKWPAIAIFVGLGAAIAFVPLQGRSLDQWLLALIKAIYRPTVFTWQKATPKQKSPQTPTKQTFKVTTAAPKAPITATTPKRSTQSAQVMPTLPTAPQPSSPPATPPSTPAPEPTTEEKTQPKARSGVIPPGQPIRIQRQSQPQAQTSSPTQKTAPQTSTPTATPTQSQASSQATFSQNLPIPHAPSTKNTIVGMTLTPDSKILDGAIVEITQNGSTIRATKSNKLGQFLFAKPLDDGTYHITAEKADFNFPTFSLQMKGEVVPPIRLQASASK